jgi:GT2 family glycosyltransferase
MKNSPLISIVLLNWNGKKYIFDSLKSVITQTYENLEIIIVDNDSHDGSIQTLQHDYPKFIYQINNTNLGFAQGMNSGIERATGKYLIALNQDVCLNNDFIEKCVEFLEAKPEISSIGASIYTWKYEEFSNILQRNEGGKLCLKKWCQGNNIPQTKNIFFTFGPPGCCPFFRKSALDNIFQITGYYFDPLFETGWEDMDIYFRLQLFGWKSMFNKSIKAWHIGSGSVDGNDTFLSKSTDYQKRIIRNRWYLIYKNIPLSVLIKISPWIILFELSLPFYLVMKTPKTLGAYIGAIRSFWSNFAKIKARRKIIMQNLKVSPNYIYKFFTTRANTR